MEMKFLLHVSNILLNLNINVVIFDLYINWRSLDFLNKKKKTNELKGSIKILKSIYSLRFLLIKYWIFKEILEWYTNQFDNTKTEITIVIRKTFQELFFTLYSFIYTRNFFWKLCKVDSVFFIVTFFYLKHIKVKLNYFTIITEHLLTMYSSFCVRELVSRIKWAHWQLDK